MAGSESFKVPSVVAQDLAIIMGFVDPPPERAFSIQGKGELVRRRKGSPNIVSRPVIDIHDDNSGSFTESEDEVEAEIAVPLKKDGTAITTTTS